MTSSIATYLEQLRARRAQLGESIAAVDQAVGESDRDRRRWRMRFRAAVAELQHDLADHVALTECEDGLYADLQATAPHLGPAVQTLLLDHVELTELTHGLLGQAETLPVDRDCRSLRRAGSDLVARLTRHRVKGAELVQRAYLVDLGGSG